MKSAEAAYGRAVGGLLLVLVAFGLVSWLQHRVSGVLAFAVLVNLGYAVKKSRDRREIRAQMQAIATALSALAAKRSGSECVDSD